MARQSNATLVLAQLWSWFEERNNEPFSAKQASKSMSVSPATMHNYLHGNDNSYFMQNAEGKWIARTETDPYEILNNEMLSEDDKQAITKAIDSTDLTTLIAIRDNFRSMKEYISTLDHYLTRQIKQLVK